MKSCGTRLSDVWSSLLLWPSFASPVAAAGVMRTPDAGNCASDTSDRRVIQFDTEQDVVAGITKLPVHVAPAASRTSSPGCAAFRAAWRSLPAATRTTRVGAP